MNPKLRRQLAEIEDFIEGFNQPTYRGIRVNGVRVATWSSQHGWSGDSRPQGRPTFWPCNSFREFGIPIAKSFEKLIVCEPCRFRQDGSFNMRLQEGGVLEMCSIEESPFEMRFHEEGAFEVHSIKESPFEMRFHEEGAFQMRSHEVGPFEVRTQEVGPLEPYLTEEGLPQISPAQIKEPSAISFTLPVLGTAPFNYCQDSGYVGRRLP